MAENEDVLNEIGWPSIASDQGLAAAAVQGTDDEVGLAAETAVDPGLDP